MADASLRGFASYYGVNGAGGLARKARRKWPPPPPISMRSVYVQLGLPLQPVNLFQGVLDPTQPQLTWGDAAAGTPLQATGWSWRITDLRGNAVPNGSGIVHAPVADLGANLVAALQKGAEYDWFVTPSNDYGTGPRAGSYLFGTAPAPSGRPAITATIDPKTDVVTVSGTGFTPDQKVNIQATVQGGPTTPTLPNGDRDDRTWYPAPPTADASGAIKNVAIAPQGFGIAVFATGVSAHVLAGETVSVVAKNSDVGSYVPGPGVSNNVTVTAQATV